MRYLAFRHELIVLSAGRPSTPGAELALRELAQVEVVGASRPGRVLSVLRAVLRGQPAQTGWMMPDRAWRAAVRLARTADVAFVNTSRSLRGPLPAPIVIDHVDALSYNMRERARGPEPLPIRIAALFESWRMSSWERRIARTVAAQIGGSKDVAGLLPSPPTVHVIPNSWMGEVFREREASSRDIDLIFTGNMDYPPNRRGADWLTEQILPRVRSMRPETSCWIVGRAADRLGVEGVHIAADVPDMFAFLRRARVAVAPVFGAGTPWKTLEAAASGAAVVSTPWGLECYELPGAVAADTEGFVDAILRLLGDETARRAQVDAMQEALAELSPARLGALVENIVATAGRSRRRLRASSAASHAPQRWLAPLPLVACTVALGTVLIDSPASVSRTGASVSAHGLPAGCRHAVTPWVRIPARLAPPRRRLDPARRYVLKLLTNCGEIDVQLAVGQAPLTTASVAYLAEHGYYDELLFNRVAPGFIIQGGQWPGVTPHGPGYEVIEPPPPGAAFTLDTVWMYHRPDAPPGSAGGEFFIVVAPRIPLPAQFAFLGTVVGGQRTVQAISQVPAVPPRDGTPITPIVILSATVAAS